MFLDLNIGKKLKKKLISTNKPEIMKEWRSPDRINDKVNKIIYQTDRKLSKFK